MTIPELLKTYHSQIDGYKYLVNLGEIPNRYESHYYFSKRLIKLARSDGHWTNMIEPMILEIEIEHIVKGEN